jgi:hypothetical protein
MTELWLAGSAFALLVFLLVSVLLPARSLSPLGQGLLLAAVLVAGLVPLSPHGLPASAYLRSITDDLAVTTWLLLCGFAWYRIRGTRHAAAARDRWQLTLLCAVAGLVLYPATLGLSFLDPYRWGFAPRTMLAVVAVLALVLWSARNYVGTLLLTAATAAFVLGVKASGNYWDYLIDPFLWFACLGAVLVKGTARLVAFFSRRPLRPAAPAPNLSDALG